MTLRVVAAAIVRDASVLAARRSQPADEAGGWEFPGGKVEADETDADALRRELREELGVDATVGAELGVANNEHIELHLYAVRLDAGEPTAQDDHDALRWLGAGDLDTVGWLPIDRELLGTLDAHLRNP